MVEPFGAELHLFALLVSERACRRAHILVRRARGHSGADSVLVAKARLGGICAVGAGGAGGADCVGSLGALLRNSLECRPAGAARLTQRGLEGERWLVLAAARDDTALLHQVLVGLTFVASAAFHVLCRASGEQDNFVVAVTGRPGDTFRVLDGAARGPRVRAGCADVARFASFRHLVCKVAIATAVALDAETILVDEAPAVAHEARAARGTFQATCRAGRTARNLLDVWLVVVAGDRRDVHQHPLGVPDAADVLAPVDRCRQRRGIASGEAEGEAHLVERDRLVEEMAVKSRCAYPDSALTTTKVVPLRVRLWDEPAGAGRGAGSSVQVQFLFACDASCGVGLVATGAANVAGWGRRKGRRRGRVCEDRTVARVSDDEVAGTGAGTVARQCLAPDWKRMLLVLPFQDTPGPGR